MTCPRIREVTAHSEISELLWRDFAEIYPGKVTSLLLKSLFLFQYSLRRDSRGALLASKRAIDTSTASKREELLRSAVLRNTNQQTSEGKITCVYQTPFQEAC